MEPIDAAFSAFKRLVAEISECGYWDSVATEADTRMKVIDRVFVEVLGWPHAEIHLESTAGKRFIDYRCTVGSLTRLIVEAKKECRDLNIKEEHAARFFKLNGAVFTSEAAQEGIAQAIYYCGLKGAELACVTNGRQWFVFRGPKGPDGTDTLEHQACVFGSLAAVENKFTIFYDLLSYPSVSSYTHRAIFREAEGQPVRRQTTKTFARNPESKRMLQGDKLSADLDRIMQAFFRDLSGEDDDEARRACFVTTSESDAAELGLTRISEELRDKVHSLGTVEASELTDAIKRVQEMRKNELVLLVGTKGAGKSTFIDRFFADVLPQDLREDCLIVRIDLAKSGGTHGVSKWLDEHFLRAAERAAFPSGAPTYDELQGMFYDEYARWRDGHAKFLYESNKIEFKNKFGDHVEQRRRDRPHEYIKLLLERIVSSHKRIPCLVFDNADHFSVPFQEEVFNYAHSLYMDAICLVILPITDTTSWQLSKQGPIQSFYTDSFFLPTPPTELVLRRRIEYIEKKLAEEQASSGRRPEVGKGYFFTRGVRLDIENIEGFAACLQTVFLKTGQVAEWIGRFANHDIRRCLQLTRQTVASPHIRVAELLAAHIGKSAMSISPEDVKMAIVRGKYDIFYHTTQSFVQNVYDLTPESETTPLLPIRILRRLESAYLTNMDNDRRYVLTEDILEYFEDMNIDARTTASCLDTMLSRGLCLSYDPTAEGIANTVKVQIAPSGRQHAAWALRDWIYIESMAAVTPMYDSELCDRIRICLAEGSPRQLRSAIDAFINYLLEEDGHLCLIPKHQSYEEQQQLRTVFAQQLKSLTSATAVAGTRRYQRSLGRVSAWKSEKGFGFVRQHDGGPDAFLHLNELVDRTIDVVPEGATVEFDVVQGPQGPRATSVVILE